MNRPIDTLQNNATHFFEGVLKKYSSQMKCAEGCSKCCYTDISIFEVEAQNIREYFLSLSKEHQEKLQELWNLPSGPGACTFLVGDRCSIYEARPIICRTQGAPLFIESQNLLDFCPLNFTQEVPLKEDWLNLERLNTLLSLAAKSSQKDQRISLSELKQDLLSLK